MELSIAFPPFEACHVTIYMKRLCIGSALTARFFFSILKN